MRIGLILILKITDDDTSADRLSYKQYNSINLKIYFSTKIVPRNGSTVLFGFL